MSDKMEVIVVHETVWQSYAKDAGSVIGALAMILPGHFLGSTILEFIGGALFIITIFSLGRKEISKGRMTLENGRAKIDAMIAARDTKP